jgi:hypothetical protein
MDLVSSRVEPTMLRRAALALLLLSPLALADRRTDVGGRYASNHGEVTLVQKGDRIVGTYVCCGGGTITGRITGNVIRYRWDQPDTWGRGVWTIEGDKLLGTWGSQDDAVSGGRWDLERKSRVELAK